MNINEVFVGWDTLSHLNLYIDLTTLRLMETTVPSEFEFKCLTTEYFPPKSDHEFEKSSHF